MVALPILTCPKCQRSTRELFDGLCTACNYDKKFIPPDIEPRLEGKRGAPQQWSEDEKRAHIQAFIDSEYKGVRPYRADHPGFPSGPTIYRFIESLPADDPLRVAYEQKAKDDIREAGVATRAAKREDHPMEEPALQEPATTSGADTELPEHVVEVLANLAKGIDEAADSFDVSKVEEGTLPQPKPRPTVLNHAKVVLKSGGVVVLDFSDIDLFTMSQGDRDFVLLLVDLVKSYEGDQELRGLLQDAARAPNNGLFDIFSWLDFLKETTS